MSNHGSDGAYRLDGESPDLGIENGRKIPEEYIASEVVLNEASKKAHATWLSLMTTLIYLIIAMVKITHKDLLLEKSVRLPILSADMPLAYFGIAAPALIFGAHTFAMLLVSGLRDKVDLWRSSLNEGYLSRADRKRLSEHLDTSLLAQAFGRDFDLRRFFSYCVTWVSVVAAPPLALTLAQLIFLPYQNPAVTDIQLVLLLCDCVAIALLWPRAPRVKAAYFIGLVIFPVTPCWLIFVFPDQPRSNFAIIDNIVERSPLLRKSARKWLAGSADLVHHSASNWLTNRLVLPDQDIASELGRDGATPTLRGRRLAFAILDRSNLNGVDFTSADLRDASLISAKLRSAKFECAEAGKSELELMVSDLSPVRSSSDALDNLYTQRCAWLHGADLHESDL
jgi:Pentapeptide repeats (8 copies)